MAETFWGIDLWKNQISEFETPGHVPMLAPPWLILGKSLHCFLCKFHHPPPSLSIIVMEINISRAAEALFKLVISNLSMSQMLNALTARHLCRTTQCPWGDSCASACDVTCFSAATVLLAQLWAGY